MPRPKSGPICALATVLVASSSTAFAQITPEQPNANPLTNAMDSTKESVSALNSDTLQPLIEQAREFLPKLGAALAILIIGWLVACIIAWVVRKVIRRTPLNGMLAKYISGEGDGAPDASGPIAKIVYYIVMLFVLIGFFQALQLDMITKPLNSFLDQVFNYAPRLIGAGILGVVAWVVARVVKAVSFKGLTAANVDGRLSSFTTPDTTDYEQAYQAVLQKNPQVAEAVQQGKLTREKVIAGIKERRAAKLAEAPPAEDGGSLSKTISETGYWLVFLLLSLIHI